METQLVFNVSWVWSGKQYTLTSDKPIQLDRSKVNDKCLVIPHYRGPITIEYMGSPFANVPSFFEANATISAKGLHDVEYTEKGQTRKFKVGSTDYFLEWKYTGEEA